MNNTTINFANKQAIKVSGSDGLSFLQGQLSNDISKIGDKTAQINALCQHQGKIIAILTIVKKDDSFYLILPNSMVDIVIKRLSMFIIMSDVKLEISDFTVVGRINGSGEYKLNAKISYDLLKNNIDTDEKFNAICIENKIPEIYPQTSEKFVPQMLNLDIDEFGVNFTKGCYTGQEVVARLHYLGKAKRRLFKFSSDFEVKIGDELIVEGSQSQKASGIVVDIVKLPDLYQFIATLEVGKTNDKITIDGKVININE